MWEAINNMSLEEWRLICIAADIVAALLTTIVLFTVYFDPMAKTRIANRYYRQFSLLLLLYCLCDIGAVRTALHPESALIYSVLLRLSYIINGLSYLCLFLYFTGIAQETRPTAGWLRRVAYISAGAFFLISLLPEPFMSFSREASVSYGYMGWTYFAVEAVQIGVLVILFLLYRGCFERGELAVSLGFVGLPLLTYILIPALPTIATMISSLGLLVLYIVTYQSRSRRLMIQAKELAEERSKLSQAQIKLMMSQLKPHFMYNTLNSIAALCTRDPKGARQLTTNFADYLRCNLGAVEEKDLVPFEKELQHTHFYTEIEKVRFGADLKVVFDVRVLSFSLPPLTVQPLVENAIKHGIRKKGGCGTVTVASFETDTDYVITVSDDGCGFDPGAMPENPGTHLGVRLITRRVETLCHGSVRLDSKPGVGTVGTITIPKEEIK